jgi:hypothetical protein
MTPRAIALALVAFAAGAALGGYGGYRFFVARLQAAFAPPAAAAGEGAPVVALAAPPHPEGPRPATALGAPRPMPDFVPAAPAPGLPDPESSIAAQREAAMAYRAYVADESRRIMEQAQWTMRRLYEREGHDPAWAATIIPRIERKLAEERPFGAAVVESTDCRVTVCKVILYNPREQFLQDARLKPGTIPTFLSWKTEFELDQGLNADRTGFRATVWIGDDFEEGHMRRVRGLVTSTTVERDGTDGGGKP